MRGGVVIAAQSVCAMSAVKTHLGRKPSPPPILPKYSSVGLHLLFFYY